MAEGDKKTNKGEVRLCLAKRLEKCDGFFSETWTFLTSGASWASNAIQTLVFGLVGYGVYYGIRKVKNDANPKNSIRRAA